MTGDSIHSRLRLWCADGVGRARKGEIVTRHIDELLPGLDRGAFWAASLEAMGCLTEILAAEGDVTPLLCLPLECSLQLETVPPKTHQQVVQRMNGIDEPPSLYVLRKDATIRMVDVEEYWRRVDGVAIGVPMPGVSVYYRSSRPFEGIAAGWEFDNCLLVIGGSCFY